MPLELRAPFQAQDRPGCATGSGIFAAVPLPLLPQALLPSVVLIPARALPLRASETEDLFGRHIRVEELEHGECTLPLDPYAG